MMRVPAWDSVAVLSTEPVIELLAVASGNLFYGVMTSDINEETDQFEHQVEWQPMTETLVPRGGGKSDA